MASQRGQSTVEWVGLVLLVAALLAGLGSVVVDASWLPPRLTCAIVASCTREAAGEQAALADPELARAFAVSSEVTPGSISPPDRVAAFAIGPRARANDTCRHAASQTVTYSALAGNQLFSFRVDLHACWDGHRVTRVDAIDPVGKVTTSGSILGWRDRGSRSPSAQYSYSYAGHPNGGYWITRTERFELCPLHVNFDIGCIQEVAVKIHLRVHYDGSMTSSWERL